MIFAVGFLKVRRIPFLKNRSGNFEESTNRSRQSRPVTFCGGRLRTEVARLAYFPCIHERRGGSGGGYPTLRGKIPGTSLGPKGPRPPLGPKASGGALFPPFAINFLRLRRATWLLFTCCTTYSDISRFSSSQPNVLTFSSPAVGYNLLFIYLKTAGCISSIF